MMYKPQKQITNERVRELPWGSVKASNPFSAEVQVGNTSGVGFSSLPEDRKMIIDKIVWNEMFRESSDESFKGFDEVWVSLISIIEESNVSKDQGHKKDPKQEGEKASYEKLFNE